MVGTSIGVMYGLDGEFKKPPHMTFFQIDVSYHFPTLLRDIFTPHIFSKIYRSRSSRKDLGILTYDYWLIRSVLAPGLTLLKRFEVYSGTGIEHSIQFDSQYDSDNVNHTEIPEGVKQYPFFEGGLVLSKTPFDYLEPSKRKITATYSYYFYDGRFHEFSIDANSDFNLPGKSIFQLKTGYSRAWGAVPFYHEIPVSTGRFKGFMGKSYYSRNVFVLSNEIRTSIFREFIYAGIYLDGTIFRGSGYDLSGIQYGIVSGPTLRVIVLGQFEIYTGLGKDYLFSKKQSQYNISFGMSKKW